MEDNLLDEFGKQFNNSTMQSASGSLNGTPKEENDIMVVGVGGGGGNAVNHMYKQGIENVTFVVCNTDAVSVKASPVPNKVVIGDGRGAGNIPEVARKFAEDDIEKIEAMFNSSARMVFITAGMGGGTGTGASPVVARVAREKGLLTVGIITIPFVFEGKVKILNALDGAEELAKYVDALLIINNERLVEIYPDLNFLNAFAKADDTLSMAALSISEIINVPGRVNLDFNDVNTMLRNGGTAIISTGYGEGERRVTKAIQDALDSPLLRNRDIQGSKRLLINLYLSEQAENSMLMSEVTELREFTSTIDSEFETKFGVTIDNTLGDKVKITILASGFDVTLRDEEQEVFDMTGKTNSKAKTPQPEKKNTEDILEKEYGASSINLTTSYIVLQPDQMDDDSVIEILESNPTYNRDKSVVDMVKKGAVARSSSADEPKTPHAGSQIVF